LIGTALMIIAAIYSDLRRIKLFRGWRRTRCGSTFT